TRQLLLDLGVPAESIKLESFTSPARATLVSGGVANDPTTHHSPLTTHHSLTQTSEPARAAVNGAATLTFARSRQSLPISSRKTVLEAAEDLGVSINYDCRSGICGQCKIKLLAGHVTMDTQDALTPVDRANNLILSCQARCMDQVAVEA